MGKTETIAVRVPPEMKRDLETLSEDGSASTVIRDALAAYLQAKRSTIRRRRKRLEAQRD